jgi:pimeloyl-ACP methyl ester carboxylesterase
MVVDERGDGDRAYVLIHGIGMGRGVFLDLTERLLSTGRVVSLDLPGYGEAPEPSRTLTIERTADLVAALLTERAYPDVTIVGHSMGSQVAVEVVARHPGLAERVVLVGPTVDARARRAPVQIARLARDVAVESPIVWARGMRAYLRAGPNLRKKLRAMLVHRPEQAYPRVHVPALVMRGEGDRVAPVRWCRQVVGLLPDASLIEIPDHGHETMIRDAEPAAAAITRFAATR